MTRKEAVEIRAMIEKQTDALSDTDILKYPGFVEKWETDTTYSVDKRIAYKDVVYKVLQAHTSQVDWTPDTAVSLYAKVLIPSTDTVPEWEQPESTNPYMKGDKVTHKGKTWTSDIDNNVWEPGVYGWTEVA